MVKEGDQLIDHLNERSRSLTPTHINRIRFPASHIVTLIFDLSKQEDIVRRVPPVTRQIEKSPEGFEVLLSNSGAVCQLERFAEIFNESCVRVMCRSPLQDRCSSEERAYGPVAALSEGRSLQCSDKPQRESAARNFHRCHVCCQSAGQLAHEAFENPAHDYVRQGSTHGQESVAIEGLWLDLSGQVLQSSPCGR